MCVQILILSSPRPHRFHQPRGQARYYLGNAEGRRGIVWSVAPPIISSLTLTSRVDRRSAIYSDRPRWVLAYEILAKGMHAGVMPYGDKYVDTAGKFASGCLLMFHVNRLRRFRKAIHAGLQPRALASYHPIEEREARIYLKEVSKNPTDFRNSVKR